MIMVAEHLECTRMHLRPCMVKRGDDLSDWGRFVGFVLYSSNMVGMRSSFLEDDLMRATPVVSLLPF